MPQTSKQRKSTLRSLKDKVWCRGDVQKIDSTRRRMKSGGRRTDPLRQAPESGDDGRCDEPQARMSAVSSCSALIQPKASEGVDTSRLGGSPKGGRSIHRLGHP